MPVSQPRRFGIVADIHANIDAFTVVLERLRQEQIDEILCLGDIVGYNAAPAECMKLVRENQIRSISGNHDRYAVGEVADNVREVTLKAIEHARSCLGAEDLEFLRALPENQLIADRFLVVHGSPRNKDEYLLTLKAINENFKHLTEVYAGINICFLGHTHIPLLAGGNEVKADFGETTTVSLDRLNRYLINPGSVGQPRDKCAKASFLIFDAGEMTVTFVREEYDFMAAREKIIDAGLPEILGDRLTVGR